MTDYLARVRYTIDLEVKVSAETDQEAVEKIHEMDDDSLFESDALDDPVVEVLVLEEV